VSKEMSRLFLNKLQGKLNKPIDEGQLRQLAGRVNKQDFADEAKLRQLIRTLAGISGATVNAEKEEHILKLFREKQVDLGDLQALRKLL